MVQRKYIVNFINHKFLYKIIGFLIILTYPFIAKSVAWLPAKGHYKFSSSLLMIDKLSKDIHKKRSMLILDAYRDMGYLLAKDKLAPWEKEELQELQEFCDSYNAFNDKLFLSQEVEYGISSKQSFGLKAYFSSEKILRYKYSKTFSNDHNFKNHITKGIGFYYKFLLYKSNNWQLVIMPEISQFGKNQVDEKFAYSTGIYLGHNDVIKSGKRYFSEFGFSISNIFNDKYKDTILKKISFTEGVELIKGLMINNYSEYSFATNGNILYKHYLYEQISLVKELENVANRKINLTAQIGYYWKKSLHNKYFEVSGPMFSVYLNI